MAGKNTRWLIRHLARAEDPLLRAAIVRELGLHRDPFLIPQLCMATGDPDHRVRTAAFQSLNVFPGSVADHTRDLAYLDGFHDPSHATRQAAIEGARARFEASIDTAMLRSRLLTLSRQARDPATRLAGTRILQQIDGEDVDQVLMELARLDPSVEVRRAAVIALGMRRVEVARGLLHQLRSRALDPQLRVEAERALARIGGRVSSAVIAVMPFDTSDPRLHDYASGLQDSFSSALTRARLATVVERSQVTRVMDELIFQDRFADDGRAVEIGRTLRASQVITGTVQLHQGRVTVIAKRIEVGTQELLDSVEVSGSIHDLEALQHEVSSRFVESFSP